jgi:cytidylate kinase
VLRKNRKLLMDKDYIITIDGPVSSGKSTIGKKLAKRRGMVYLDTGAMYRVVGLESKRRGISPDDQEGLKKLCEDIKISFKQAQDGQKVFSSDEDVTDAIRLPEISMLASRVSAEKPVRESLVAHQRDAGSDGNIVVDGRDAGTVIFPNARFKFYLDAGVEERAKRRHKELVEKELEVSYTKIFQDIERRDKDDRSRALSPLKPAEDAVIIDTTSMTIEDVLDAIGSKVGSGTALLP